jgi:hypothetical protein
MQTPFVVKKNLTDLEIENFQNRFGTLNGFDCSVRENVWRRHQVEDNKELSGWKGESDCRRRLVHFRDKYDIIDNDFCLVETYIYINLTLPTEEISAAIDFYEKIKDVEIQIYDVHPEDVAANREHKGYKSIDATLCSEPQPIEVKKRPWNIFKTGIRKQIPKGNPTRINKSELVDFLPAHIELGCGPSTEAGIPALNYFHDLFSINKNSFFVFDANINSLWSNEWFNKTTFMQKCCLCAKPTSFYFKVRELIDSGDIIQPIFNNNFDGLSKSLGIDELCLRKFDFTGLYPDYDFDDCAKSLIVVGSHADRRGCQAAARKKGLKILYIDPEGYSNGNNFVSYPLESPQTNEFVLNVEAKDAF